MGDWNEAETVSLSPVPTAVWQALPERERQLNAIADQIAYWLRYEIEQRNAESLETPPDTHVRLNGYEGCPPHWPSVGQLKRWLLVLRGDVMPLKGGRG